VTLAGPLLGWRTDELDDAARKSFEVALHAGTLGALLVLVPLPPLRLASVTTAVPSVVGLALEGPIERRLGGVRATALGLVAGSALLVVTDARASRGRRNAGEAQFMDALAVGGAQALALAPGLSRLGMCVAVARARGFTREAAFALARPAGLPVVAGATVLRGVGLARRGLAPELRGPFVAGAVAAFAGTLAAAPLARSTAIRGPALERVLLALAALRRR
jgi:undecaprenyl-diphosphatase